MAVELALYAALCRETLLDIRGQSGIERLQLQILVLGGSTTVFAVFLLMALRGGMRAKWPIELQPWVVLVFYTATVVAISTRRIFNARQLVVYAADKFVVVAAAALSAYCLEVIFSLAGVPTPIGYLLTMAVVIWLVGQLNRGLDRFLHFYPEAGAVRQAAYAAAHRETRLDALQAAFVTMLKGWGHSENALLVVHHTRSENGAISDAADAAVIAAMRHFRWVTPERLARERWSREHAILTRYLEQHSLWVLVIAEGPALTVIAGVGAAPTRVPYTYPQVTQLLEVASIIESALERSHLSTKAQHAEQLATVGLLGASVAHEIRNPLVTIKSFVQLLPAHYQDQRFREKFFRLIGDEVNRIDRLTEQLLDLASPRAYAAARVDLHPIMRATLDLIAAKAAHKSVRVVEDLRANPDEVFTDSAAAKQVLLNLCFNAIQALEMKEGERQLRLASRRLEQSVEVIIADNGPGIAPEMRARLFEPFQTTKSTGFGLGLAICSDILSHLNATISVDPAEPGAGATFRVNFPCQPLSS